MDASRIVIVLWPNTGRIDFVLVDKKFNNEQYSFSRKDPVGHEQRMLKRLKNVSGVEKAEASKHTLSLDVDDDAFVMREYLPQVLEIVREFAGPDHGKTVYVNNKRRVGEEYDGEGWRVIKGTKADIPDLGFEFELFDGDYKEEE